MPCITAPLCLPDSSKGSKALFTLKPQGHRAPPQAQALQHSATLSLGHLTASYRVVRGESVPQRAPLNPRQQEWGNGCLSLYCGPVHTCGNQTQDTFSPIKWRIRMRHPLGSLPALEALQFLDNKSESQKVLPRVTELMNSTRGKTLMSLFPDST